MSIAGYPMDHGDQGPHDDGRATPAGGPPDDWDKRFTAIVSGISGEMRWSATPADLDGSAETAADTKAKTDRLHAIGRAPAGIWADLDQAPDTADDRKMRRDLRRAERAAALEAFQEAQRELQAARAADTEHFVPPEPPPLPRFRRRTVGALVLLVLGLILVIAPALLPAPFELAAVIGIALVVVGGGVLFTGLRRHRDATDDGSHV